MNEKYIKIAKREHPFEREGSASTYNVETLNSFDAEVLLKDTESAIKSKLIGLLSELKGFQFVTTLGLAFKKIDSKYKTKYENFNSSSKAEIIIDENDTASVFKLIYTTIIGNIKKSLGKDLGY